MATALLGEDQFSLSGPGLSLGPATVVSSFRWQITFAVIYFSVKLLLSPLYLRFLRSIQQQWKVIQYKNQNSAWRPRRQQLERYLKGIHQGRTYIYYEAYCAVAVGRYVNFYRYNDTGMSSIVIEQD